MLKRIDQWWIRDHRHMSIARHNHCKEGERATIVKMTYWTESIIPFSHRGLNSNLGTNSSWIIFAVTLIRSIMLLVHLAPVLLGQMGVWQNWQGKTIFPHLAFSTRCLVTGMILTGKVATYRHMYWAEPKEPTQFGSISGSEIQNLPFSDSGIVHLHRSEPKEPT